MSVGHPENRGAPPADNGAVRPKADEIEPSERPPKTNEHDLSLIISTIPGMLWSAAPDGAVDYCNRPWLEFAAMNAEQAKGWGWTATVYDDDRQKVIESWRLSLSSGEPFEAEARVRRFDGVYRWFLFRANPLRDQSGNIIKWYGTNIDIEDRKKAEDAVRANEQALRSTINAIPTTAWATRPDGYCEFLNSRWLDYAGMTAEECEGWGWGAAIHPEDVDRLVTYWQGCLDTGTPVEIEARMRRFDGVYRWFLFRANPQRDQTGKIVRWYGTNIDIEDRKQAEDAVRANEQALRATINAIPTTAWSTRPDGFCEFLNSRWLEYAGMTTEQAEGWGWGSVIHPDDAERLVKYWQSCLETGMPAEVEARMRRFDGVYRWFLFRANPMRDESGNILRWYGTNIDIEDRKQAEDTVRANEQALRSTINAIPTPAWSTQPNGAVDFLNQRWLEYAGMTAEEALGWGWQESIHPDDLETLARQWRLCLASGVAAEVEARHRRHDGVYRWFLVRANPLHDESGSVVKWYGTNIDIDDRKRAEEVLQSNERTLQKIVNTIPALAWSSRPDGYVTFLNQRWLDYAGITAEQGEGWGWIKAIHPDDVGRLSIHWQAILASGEPAEIEGRLRRFDGTYRWFLFRSTVLKDASGNVVQWYGFNTDIDDRRHAEEQLKRSEAQLAEGQRLSRTGTFAWRPGTATSTWSEELYRIHEIVPGTTIPADIALIAIHPDDSPQVRKAINAGVESGRDYQHTHRIVMPDGRIKFLQVMARASRDSEDRLEYIGAVQDVTERMLSEEALTRSRSELAHITRVMSLGILTASIAHEINQPLAGIITNAETCLQMLDDQPPDIEGARDTALRSIRDGNRASDVIVRLRSLFKREGVVTENIDLNEAAREVIALLSGELRRNRVILEQDYAQDLPAVTGDRVQLQQVILNLLRNAIDAMKEVEDRPRSLFVGTEKDGDEIIRFVVKDAGNGFPSDIADKLFESFYSTKKEGMGVGLAISRSIIEAHRGRIWGALNQGPGAIFTFSLPRSANSG